MNKQRLLQLVTKAAFVFVMMFALAATSVMAQTFYVSASSGNDAFDGSSPNVVSGLVGPFKTIAAANAVAGDGDVIVIEAGTYNEDVAFTADVAIQLTASGANTTVLVGTANGAADITFNSNPISVTNTGARLTFGAGLIGDDIVFDAGVVTLGANALAVPSGATIVMDEGSLAGSAPVFGANTNISYVDATGGSVTAGLEVPASMGTGTLTLSQTGGSITFPNALTVNAINSNDTQDVTFSSAVTAAGLVQSTANGDLAFTTGLTANGGITMAGTGAFSAGTVTLGVLDVITIGAGNSYSVSGATTVLVDADDWRGVAAPAPEIVYPAADVTPIVNGGTATLGSLAFTFSTADADAAGSKAVDVLVDNNGTMTVGSWSQSATTANTDAAAAATDKVSIRVSFDNSSKATFTSSTAISGQLINSAATPNGTFFNGGGSIALNVNNSGTVHVGAGQTLELTADDTDPVAGGVQQHTQLDDFNGATGTLLISGDAAQPAGGVNVQGNLTVSGDGSFGAAVVVGSTFTWSGDGDITLGGLDVNGNASITGNGNDITGDTDIDGSAVLGSTTAADDGPDFTGDLNVDGALTVNNDVTVEGVGTTNSLTTASVSVNSVLTLNGDQNGTSHNVSGTLAVNSGGSVVLAPGGAAGDVVITVGTTIIDPAATGITLGANNRYVAQGNFTGGLFDGTGLGSELRFDLPGSGATFSPGPNTQVFNLTITGNERTLVLAQSVEVWNDFSVADDATLDLTNRLVRMTAMGAGNNNGAVIVATDASIIATQTTGAISFEGAGGTDLFTIDSDTPGTDIGTLTNLVVSMTGAATAADVTITDDVSITGVVSLVNGGITVQGGDTMTFDNSGNTAGVSRTVSGANTTITGTVAGQYDLTYNGATVGPTAVGNEYSATSIDDLTISTTGGGSNGGLLNAGSVSLNSTGAVSIAGNFTVSATSTAILFDDLTVGGNMTIAATDASDGTVGSNAGEDLIMSSATARTHDINGRINSDLFFNSDATVTGDSDNDRESNVMNVTVNAGDTVTINGLQEILGNLVVNGSLDLALADADGAGADDQDVEGTVLVDESGTLTLSSNVAVAGATTIGNDGAAGGVATLNMNSLRYTANGTFTSDADANLGTTGTLEVNANFGTNGADVPNLNVDTAGIAMTSDVDVVNLDVDEDFSIGAFDLSIYGDGTFTSTAAPVTITGTGEFITRGTTLTMSQNVEVPNYRLNSTGTTTLASGVANTLFDFIVDNTGAGTGTARFDAGELALGGQDFVVREGVGAAAEAVIDYNGGTITGSGAFVINDDNDNAGGIDLDTNNLTMTVPTLTVNIGGAAAGDVDDGLDVGASDGLMVSTRLNLTGGTVFTDNGTTDATLSFGDGARIVRNQGVLEQVPTFGAAMDIEYDGAVTTALELPNTVNELQIDAAVQLANARNVTASLLDLNAVLTITNAGAGAESLTIVDGGLVQVSVGAPVVSAAGEYVYGGAYALTYDAAQGGLVNTDNTVYSGSPSTLTIANGSTAAPGGQTVALGANKSAGNVVVGDDDVLAMGTRNLTVSGNLTQTGSVTATTGTLAFAGTTGAQTFTLPAGGNTLPNVTINNAAGVDLSGGNLNVTTLATFTSGNVRTGASNAMVLNHSSTGVQNFVQTAGGVVGNIRKFIVGGGLGAAADRMTFPAAAADGTARPVSITFNQPNQIGASVVGASGIAGFSASTGISLTVNHVEASPGGNNNLPLTTMDNLGQDLTIARYPDFHWLITANSTLSPSVDYDIELDGAGFSEFAGEDIERTRTIRRQGGATTNFWTLVGPTAGANDNFAVSATNPVTVVRNAVGALNAGNGVLFTMGLESNMTVTNPAAVSVNAGATGTVDLTTVFGGGTGAYSYAITSGDAAVATGAAAANTLTVTGVAAGSTTLTVVATDILNDTRTATVSVTVNPALAAGTVEAVALNAGGTSTVDLSTVFTGGADPVTYVVASDDAAVATGAEATGTLTITAVAAGTATVSVTATDGTGQTATATVAVSVNAALAVTNPATITLLEGASSTVDLSTVFAGGDGTYMYTVTSASDANVTGAEASGTLTVTAVEAYAAGTTIGTTDVTVVATDGIGDSVTATIVVDVLPVLGDLDGSGAPSEASASLALDYFLGLTTLTTKQQTAADFNSDGFVTPFDAALIFDAAFPGKTEIAAYVASDLTFGELVRESGMISIPVQLTGNLNEVVSASFSAQIDPAFATVESVVSELGEGWIVKHVVSEDGQLRIAIAGFGEIEADGVVATINLQLVDSAPAFNLSAEGAVNNNPVANIDAVEVVELPETFALQGNYPNPFNPSTTVQFDLPETADVEIQIFDMLGRQVMALPSQTIQAGAKRSVQLNASQLASGSYFYRVIAKMESKTLVESGRMTLVK